MKATSAQIAKAKNKVGGLRDKQIRAEERESVSQRKVQETANKYLQCKAGGKPPNMSEVAYTSKKRKLHADWEKAKARNEKVYWAFRAVKAAGDEAERKYKTLFKG